MKRSLFAVVSLVLIASMVLSACGVTPTPTQPPPTATQTAVATTAPTAVPTAEATPEPAATPTATPIVIENPEVPAGAKAIRWYIGLGAGSNPEEIEKEKAFQAKFNAKYGSKYTLILDVVSNATAYDVLKTQIAAGDVPDIVGPVGVRGLWSFEGAWLDLAPYVEKTSYDLSDFNPALVDFYKLGPQGQIGLPFAVYPSALWYNKDLFDEAGLEYPPHEFGAKYADGDDWTFDKLAELATFLTVDANGNDATMSSYDPENAVQFGYYPQWTDLRGQWTFFEAGSFNDNGTATLPEVWKEAAKWHFDAMWKTHFMPTSNYVNSDLLAQGNVFSSGKVAMVPIHTWYTCCFGEVKWDIAAIPSYNGKITAKLHADTFSILKGSKDPDAAFEVLSLFLGEFAPDLVALYGAFPARASLQDSALATMAGTYPDVDLNVFIEALSYPDNPNHESGMPNFLKASDRYSTFASLYQSDGTIDLDAELNTLIADLQTIFDEVK